MNTKYNILFMPRPKIDFIGCYAIFVDMMRVGGGVDMLYYYHLFNIDIKNIDTTLFPFYYYYYQDFFLFLFMNKKNCYAS